VVLPCGAIVSIPLQLSPRSNRLSFILALSYRGLMELARGQGGPVDPSKHETPRLRLATDA